MKDRGLLRRVGSSISDFLLTNDYSPALILFIINFILIFAIFLPNLSDINAWDEAAYVHGGMAMIEDGELPSLAANPLTTLFFSITYLPFRESTFWMVHSISLGRAILFALLWMGAYLVANEFEGFASPLIALGFLFVTPLTLEMLRFPSDPLFAALAALSLWQLLKFHHNPERSHAIYASIFMALAALARLDGLILFLILVLLVAVLSFRKGHFWSAIASTIAPFLAIVGGYILLFGVVTGDFETGMNQRTYQNFETGQLQIIANDLGISSTIEARLETRSLFGTPEENQNSVFRAIARNPGAYLDRVVAVAKSLPETLLKAYGIRYSFVLFYLVLRGLAALFKRKEYALTLIILLWPTHLLTGFVITLFRTGHLQFPYYVVFVTAGIGLATTLSNLTNSFERRTLSVILLGAILYGLLDNKLAIFYGAALTLMAVWTIIILQRRTQISKLSALLVLLSAGLILRDGFPSPIIRSLGVDPKEQAVAFLAGNYPPNTFVGTGSPGVVWAARLKPASLTSTDVPLDRSPEEFLDWIKRQGIDLIYVDHDLYAFSPAIWGMIEPNIGLTLNRVFSLEGGNFQILELSE